MVYILAGLGGLLAAELNLSILAAILIGIGSAVVSLVVERLYFGPRTRTAMRVALLGGLAYSCYAAIAYNFILLGPFVACAALLVSERLDRIGVVGDLAGEPMNADERAAYGRVIKGLFRKS